MSLKICVEHDTEICFSSNECCPACKLEDDVDERDEAIRQFRHKVEVLEKQLDAANKIVEHDHL